MSAVSRETARDELAALLSTALVGAGLQAQAAYNYLVGDFGGQWPVTVVGSAGSERTRAYLGASVWHTWIYLNIYIFVLYADAAAGWTEAMAEDRLDAIEAVIADVLMANKVHAGYWDAIEFAGKTTITGIVEGGKEYRHEMLPVKVRVMNG